MKFEELFRQFDCEGEEPHQEQVSQSELEQLRGDLDLGARMLRSFEREYNTEIRRGVRLFESLRANALEEVKLRQRMTDTGQNFSMEGLIHRKSQPDYERIFENPKPRVIVNEARFLIMVDASYSMTRGEERSSFNAAATLATVSLLAIEKAGFRTGLGFFSGEESRGTNGYLVYGPEDRRRQRLDALAEIAAAISCSQGGKTRDDPIYHILPGGIGFMQNTSADHAIGAVIRSVSDTRDSAPGQFHGLIFTDGAFNKIDRFAELKQHNPHITWSVLSYPTAQETAKQLFGEACVGTVSLDAGFVEKVFHVFKATLEAGGGVQEKDRLSRRFKEAVSQAKRHNINEEIVKRSDWKI